MSHIILAAIDISDPESVPPILRRADALTRLDGSRLAVVSVIPDFGMSIVGSFFKEGAAHEAKAHANRELHRLVAATLGDDAGIKHILCQGSTYQEILKCAERISASLILIGASRPDLKNYLLGPNAARVLRHARCSVYVMR